MTPPASIGQCISANHCRAPPSPDRKTRRLSIIHSFFQSYIIQCFTCRFILLYFEVAERVFLCLFEIDSSFGVEIGQAFQGKLFSFCKDREGFLFRSLEELPGFVFITDNMSQMVTFAIEVR